MVCSNVGEVFRHFCVVVLTSAVVFGVQALPDPAIKITFDDTSSTQWYRSTGTGGHGSGKAYNSGGNYSVNGKNAIGNFDATRLGYGLRDCSPWGNIVSPGTTFTLGLSFKTVTASNHVMFCLGGMRGNNETLLVLSKSANSICLAVEKKTAIQRTFEIPVADVTRYHAYVFRYNNGTVTAEVDGVAANGSIAYSHSSNLLQILGGYNKQNELAAYPHGCGTVNTTSWVVTTPNPDNVVDDMRIWTGTLLTEAEGLEYAALFGDSDESLDGTTLTIGKGELHSSYPDFQGCTCVEKVTTGLARFDAVKTFPALSVQAGEVSFQNGLAEAYEVTGALTLAGGTTLDVDVAADRCDAFAPGSLDLSGASAANPVRFNFRLIGGTEAAQGLVLISNGLVAGDEEKFAAASGVDATFSVRNGALVVDLVLAPEIKLTFDTPTNPAWRNNEGSDTRVVWGGNYSPNGKNAIANFVDTKLGKGIWGTSPWYTSVNLGSEFTFATRFKTVAAANHVLLCLGSMRQGNAETLLVLSESANSICLAVEKNSAIQRTLSVPVADVTQYHSYVFRHAANGAVTVEVDGVPAAGSIQYTFANKCFQVLGGYNKQNNLPAYPHGCGVVNTSSWVVTTPNADNVCDDVRFWSTRLLSSTGPAADYYRTFGDIDWSLEGTTLVVRNGEVAATLIPNDCTLISKVTDGTMRVASVTAFTMPVTVSAGGLAFADGAAKTYAFDALTLAGGTHLGLDVTATAADSLVPATLDLTGVTAEAPIVLDFVLDEDSSFATVPTLIAQGLAAGDEAKFTYTGLPAGTLVLFVENGALKARYADLSLVVTATWTGLGRTGDRTDPANWECRNAVNDVMPDQLPTADTVVTVPGTTAGSFSLARGESLVCKSLSIGSPIALTSDCDWTGVPVEALPAGVTIDLLGHNLRLLPPTATTPALTVTDSLTPGGALFLDVDAGETASVDNAQFNVTGNARFIKDTPGTLNWVSGTIAASVPMFISNGVFRLAMASQNVFGSSGTITIANKGQLDTSNKGVGSLVNRTFYIEGEGPDGSGALLNSQNTAINMKTAILTGDATFGGKGRLDFRASSVGGSCSLHGEDYTLTIKNTSVVAFCGGNSSIYVKRVVVTDGGFFQPCGDSTGDFSISEKIVLTNGGKLITWTNKATPYEVNMPVEVGEGGGVIGSTQNEYKFNGKVTVSAGNTLKVQDRTGTFTDVEIAAGATVNVLNGTSTNLGLAGTLLNNGTFLLTSGTARFLDACTVLGTGEIRLAGGTATLLARASGFQGKLVLEDGTLSEQGVGSFASRTVIDLSKKTGGDFSYDNRNWTGPENADFGIFFGERLKGIHPNDKVMSWTTRPSVRFHEVNGKFSFARKGDGLYVEKGLLVLIR